MILGSLAGLPPLAIDLYLPALPSLTHGLHAGRERAIASGGSPASEPRITIERSWRLRPVVGVSLAIGQDDMPTDSGRARAAERSQTPAGLVNRPRSQSQDAAMSAFRRDNCHDGGSRMQA